MLQRFLDPAVLHGISSLDLVAKTVVDGFVAANANDFGASLCGGQFAFGVGNPDTTIFSTNVINDGGWHHCVATRVKSAGALSLYVDGVLQATGTGTTNSLDAASILRFGAIAGSKDAVPIAWREAVAAR